MSRSAKMGELKRAAQQLGVTSSVLRQQGWKTASDARIAAVLNDPPEWLDHARERRRKQMVKRRIMHQRNTTAQRLGVQVRAVKAYGVDPSDVEAILADPPDWLVTERKRKRTQVERAKADAERRDAADARQAEIDDAYLRAYKDGGDTDGWAAGVLHAAGIHTIVDQDGREVPVLPPALRTV